MEPDGVTGALAHGFPVGILYPERGGYFASCLNQAGLATPQFSEGSVSSSLPAKDARDASADVLPDLLDRLTSLVRHYEAIEGSLEDGVVAPIRHRRRPSDDFIEQLLDLASRFDACRAELASCGIDLPDDPPVPRMIDLLEKSIGKKTWGEFASAAAAILRTIPQITYPAPEPPKPLLDLRDEAARALSELTAATGTVEEWQPRLAPFSALVRLVSDSNIDADTAEQLEGLVAGTFGDLLVRRTFLNKLRLETEQAAGEPGSDRSPDRSAEPAIAATVVETPPVDRTVEPASTASVADSGRPPAAVAPGSPQRATPRHPEPQPERVADASPPTESESNAAAQTRPSAAVATPNSPLPAVIVRPIPDELKTFEAFRNRHWLNPVTGECEDAPWLDAEITAKLQDLSRRILEEVAAGDDHRLPELWLASRKLESTNDAVVSTDTVASIAELTASPDSATAGGDADRIQRVRRLGEDDSEELRLGIVLEAIRPTLSAPLPEEERDRLVSAAQFKDGTIRAVVHDLLRAHSQGAEDTIGQLRSALKTNLDSKKDPAAILASKRKLLADELHRLQRNAGAGYVGKFDHCSAAWMDFMRNHARPLAVRLQGDPVAMEPAVSAAEALGLVAIHRRIAEEYTVRDRSRKIMDRAAASLAKHLAAVAVARQEVADGKRSKSPPNAKLVEDTKRLLDLTATADPVDRVALRLLKIALNPPATGSAAVPLPLGTRFLSTYPAFIDHLEEAIDWQALPAVEDLPEDRPEAGAILLFPHADPLRDGERKALEDRLREERRFERLAKLRFPLAQNDSTGANQERDSILVRLQAAKDRLRKGWRRLEGLLVASQAENRRILDSAERVDGADTDFRLLCTWIEHAARFTETQGEEALRYWETALADDPVRLAALQAGRYSQATLNPEVPRGVAAPLRETAWRHHAQKAFPEPRRVLLALRSQAPIAEKWTGELHDRAKRHQTLASLLTEFSKWVFPSRIFSDYTKERTTYTLETKHVRDYLRPSQPTYLPQLHDARAIVVATVPESPASRDYRKQALEVIRAQGDNRIVILLCPGLTPENREQIRRAQHSTSSFAATVDDLDLIRLLNPEGAQPNLLIGLLEIALEQQPRKSRNPFTLPQGKEMRLEMYVGRREEAEQLATTAAKTRLFSGRKLGKTALLQFIRQTWNRRELPNGQLLRVVYLSIIGVTTEENFAKKMLEQLRVEFPSMPLPPHLAAPSDILDVMASILDSVPGESMLFVLDEADAFVAEQVKLDSIRKGQGLSWKLRDFDRARFVFTGYWATATRDGVWYNWGDVLELAQLLPEEAAGLIAHPLARLGIDAADLAPEIAFRCGYQPAVLLRFGEALIERLGQDSAKDRIDVGPELVQDVFSDVRVQREIGGVVRANFQSNPFGSAVFCVVLRESARAPLGHWLSDLEPTVASTFGPLVDASVRADLPATIATQLRDMHQRKLLLRRVREGQVEYQLTFPHHLATLLQDLDIDAEIGFNIRAWQGSQSGAIDAPLGEGRSPVHRLDLATLRELVTPEYADLAPKVVVVASTWPSSLVHEPGGIPERLGLRLRVEPAAGYTAQSEVRCWQQAGPEELSRVLDDPPEKKPAFLFGDVAILRAGLARRAKGDLDIEVIGTHRFTDGQVRWWFQRVMGVEFASEGDYERVHQVTGGVPFLVEMFQKFLMPGGSPDGGLTPSADALSEAFDSFRRFIESDAVARRAFPHLHPRENELLRMVSIVSTELFGDAEARYRPMGEWIADAWTVDDFGDAWRGTFPNSPFPGPYGSDADDLVALETIILSGMARSGRDSGPAHARLFAFVPDDPVKTLVNRLA